MSPITGKFCDIGFLDGEWIMTWELSRASTWNEIKKELENIRDKRNTFLP
jgi:hypothetical protein